MKNQNDAAVSGIISDVRTVGFAFKGEICKAFFIKTERKSGNLDFIPVFVSAKYPGEISEGKKVFIVGEYISYNEKENGKSRLILMLHAKYIREETVSLNENKIVMDGYLCKPPVLRITPKGIDICDLLIANNDGDRTNYIPCITWHARALEASRFKVGDRIKLIGRIQSRIYQKRIDAGQIEIRTAYEVSVGRVIEHEEGRSKKDKPGELQKISE